MFREIPLGFMLRNQSERYVTLGACGQSGDFFIGFAITDSNVPHFSYRLGPAVQGKATLSRRRDHASQTPHSPVPIPVLAGPSVPGAKANS